MGHFAVGMVLATPAYFYYDAVQEERRRQLHIRTIRDKVFFDIAIGDVYAGRILIGLYSDQVPLTCENFIQLAKGYEIKDKKIGYRNTLIHKIKPGLACYGGDVLTGQGGSHGMSIFGKFFPDENFECEFVQEGDVAMNNWGENTNASQFMITFCKPKIFYGKNVVFGTVVKGMKVVRQIADLGTTTGRPVLPVRILECGLYDDNDPFPLPDCATIPPSPTISEEEYVVQQKEKEEARKAAAIASTAATDKKTVPSK